MMGIPVVQRQLPNSVILSILKILLSRPSEFLWNFFHNYLASPAGLLSYHA
jgi:hypothetical protein